MLCICHSPHLTLCSTSLPPAGQKNICCAFFLFLSPLSLTVRHRFSSFVKSTFSRLSSSSLLTAGKSYVWLALCDIFAVAVFVWEGFSQWVDYSSESSGKSSRVGSRSVARLWLALTFRQTCFLIISALILIHVRRRKSVSFGRAHWYLWVPLLFFGGVSTVAASLIADRIPRSFLIGYILYSSTTAVLNTVIFGTLVGGLILVKRSLANIEFEKARVSEPPGETIAEKPPQLTLDIDPIREGSLWVTSVGSSHRCNERNSAYSHSRTSSCTHTTQNIAIPPGQATPPRLPFWPPQGTHPSSSSRNSLPRRDDIHANDFGQAPFRYRTQSLRAAAAAAAALTVNSRGSWISSSLGTRPLSAWSYPTQCSILPSRAQCAAEDATALASDQHAHSAPQAERVTTSPASATSHSQEIEISTLRILAWLAGVWAPLVRLFYCCDHTSWFYISY
jgi:hypothetical protein